MALTTHWEWRAFGTVSEQFQSRFDRLDPAFGGAAQGFVDEYLWLPGVGINVKFRKGTADQDGLKLKRLHETQGPLEKWSESADEIFAFPLSERAWRTLLAEMNLRTGIDAHPPLDADREGAVAFLQSINARVRTVKVVKERRAALWGTPASVKVELAVISSPWKVTSVGLESFEPDAIAQLQAAIADLGLASEGGLAQMNYLKFIAQRTGWPSLP